FEWLVLSLKLIISPSLLTRFFFFFQAEDGIRDLTVTGVQTCALPIWAAPRAEAARQCRRGVPRGFCSRRRPQAGTPSRSVPISRSEERRVGKECRFRRAQEHEKKKVTGKWRATLSSTYAKSHTSSGML